ncbi:hypothetical protein A4R44_03001 [Amycolatopsis sp. M39]|nr:hypothetical protein A4R44_03001 [Amycolatopsis sp. M39]
MRRLGVGRQQNQPRDRGLGSRHERRGPPAHAVPGHEHPRSIDAALGPQKTNGRDGMRHVLRRHREARRGRQLGTGVGHLAEAQRRDAARSQVPREILERLVRPGRLVAVEDSASAEQDHARPRPLPSRHGQRPPCRMGFRGKNDILLNERRFVRIGRFGPSHSGREPKPRDGSRRVDRQHHEESAPRADDRHLNPRQPRARRLGGRFAERSHRTVLADLRIPRRFQHHAGHRRPRLRREPRLHLAKPAVPHLPGDSSHCSQYMRMVALYETIQEWTC